MGLLAYLDGAIRVPACLGLGVMELVHGVF